MKILRESAQINTAAEKDYLDGLSANPAYIDIDAFHLAYDDIIKEVGAHLEDLFYKKGDQILKKKSSYGEIKLMQGYNKPVYDALISLWLAQFKNNLPLKKDVLAAGAKTNTKTTKPAPKALSHNAELVIKAVEILNNTRGTKFKLDNIHEGDSGSVYFTMTYSSGKQSSWGFPVGWFNPEHTHSEQVLKILDKIPADWTDDQKIVAKLMAYLWGIRNDV